MNWRRWIGPLTGLSRLASCDNRRCRLPCPQNHRPFSGPVRATDLPSDWTWMIVNAESSGVTEVGTEKRPCRQERFSVDDKSPKRSSTADYSREVRLYEAMSALGVDSGRITRNSPGNKRRSRLFPVTTDGAKRRSMLGNNPVARLAGNLVWNQPYLDNRLRLICWPPFLLHTNSLLRLIKT